MELEGVLGLVDMLRELLRPMRMFLGLYDRLQTSTDILELFPPLFFPDLKQGGKQSAAAMPEAKIMEIFTKNTLKFKHFRL